MSRRSDAWSALDGLLDLATSAEEVTLYHVGRDPDHFRLYADGREVISGDRQEFRDGLPELRDLSEEGRS